MDRGMLSNTVLAMLVTLTVTSLWALGESRFDAYVSIYALNYMIVKSVLRPRRKAPDFLAISLLLAFSVAVALRVLEVLGVAP